MIGRLRALLTKTRRRPPVRTERVGSDPLSHLESQFAAAARGLRAGAPRAGTGNLGDLYLTRFAEGDALGGRALTVDQADWLSGLKVRGLLAAAAGFLGGNVAAVRGLSPGQLTGLLAGLNEALYGTTASDWASLHLSLTA